MKGQLCVFYADNKQVGGGLSWEITFDLIDTLGGKRPMNWEIKANTFWFNSNIKKVLACFFWIVTKKLILAYKDNLLIENVGFELNKKHKQPLYLSKEVL